ncbi:MAG: CbiX/SirB N-terminal domain-containing protein [Methanocella sp.]
MKDTLLIIGHGSKDPGADDVLPYYVEQLRQSGRFSIVDACYLEKPPYIKDALGGITADRIFIMPLLVAPGYHTRVTIPEAIKASGKTAILLEPLGRSEHITRLIEERVGSAVITK